MSGARRFGSSLVWTDWNQDSDTYGICEYLSSNYGTEALLVDHSSHQCGGEGNMWGRHVHGYVRHDVARRTVRDRYNQSTMPIDYRTGRCSVACVDNEDSFLEYLRKTQAKIIYIGDKLKEKYLSLPYEVGISYVEEIKKDDEVVTSDVPEIKKEACPARVSKKDACPARVSFLKTMFDDLLNACEDKSITNYYDFLEKCPEVAMRYHYHLQFRSMLKKVFDVIEVRRYSKP